MVDRALAPGAQIAQACHIMREWTAKHPEGDAEWYANSNYLACLSASQSDIQRLIAKCEKKKIPYAVFREPDFDNQITGIALAPGDEARRACSSLPLALKGF